MADWKSQLKSIEISERKKIDLEPTKANEERTTRTHDDSYYNLASIIDRLIKKISSEKKKSYKEKNFNLIKELEKELDTRRRENINLIARLRQYYPDLSVSEIGARQHILEAEIKNKKSELEAKRVAKLKAEELRKREEELRLEAIEEERVKKELAARQKKSKDLISFYKIKKCKQCTGGYQTIICPNCHGTLICSPREIVVSQRFSCSNTSPKCPTCSGTGVGWQEKKVISTTCDCRNGMAVVACETCYGTRLEATNQSQKDLIDQIKSDLEVVKIIKKLIKFRD